MVITLGPNGGRCAGGAPGPKGPPGQASGTQPSQTPDRQGLKGACWRHSREVFQFSVSGQAGVVVETGALRRREGSDAPPGPGSRRVSAQTRASLKPG